jgi:hypothetical protein
VGQTAREPEAGRPALVAERRLLCVAQLCRMNPACLRATGTPTLVGRGVRSRGRVLCQEGRPCLPKPRGNHRFVGRTDLPYRMRADAVNRSCRRRCSFGGCSLLRVGTLSTASLIWPGRAWTEAPLTPRTRPGRVRSSNSPGPHTRLRGPHAPRGGAGLGTRWNASLPRCSQSARIHVPGYEKQTVHGQAGPPISDGSGDLELPRLPLTRPAATLSPTGGEGRVRGRSVHGKPTPPRSGRQLW